MEPAQAAARAAICGVRSSPARAGAAAGVLVAWPPVCRCWPAPSAPSSAAPATAGRPRDPPRAADRLLGARERRRIAGRRCDLAPRGDPQRVLHFSATLTFAEQLHLQRGRRYLPEAVGVPPSPRRRRTASARSQARSCQSRHRKDGGAIRRRALARRRRHVDDVPGERAPDRRRAPGDRGGRQAVVPEPTYGTQLQGSRSRGKSPKQRRASPTRTGPRRARRRPGGGPPASRAIGRRTSGYGPLRPARPPRVSPPMIGSASSKMVDEADIRPRRPRRPERGRHLGAPNRVWSMEHGRRCWAVRAGRRARATIATSGGCVHRRHGPVLGALPGAAGDCTRAQSLLPGAPTGRDSAAPASRWRRRCSTSWCSMRAISPCRCAGVDATRTCCAEAGLYQIRPCGLSPAKYLTRRDPEGPEAEPQPSADTDLLLDDMGRARRRPIGRPATAGTANPAALGHRLTATVSGHTAFLHDGRARQPARSGARGTAARPSAAKQRGVPTKRRGARGIAAFLASP